MKPSFFITGTDTEIGKTYATACIAHTLKQVLPEQKVNVRKPIASGAIQINNKWVSEDALILQKASQTQDELSTINPYLFKEPISPERAIKQNQNAIYIQDLKSACKLKSDALTLIEGAGGFYSPLALDGNNGDLAQQLKLPVILVVGNRLGCINHALLTIEAIQRKALDIALVIINDVSESADSNNIQDIARLSQMPCAHLSYQADGKLQTIANLQNLLNL